MRPSAFTDGNKAYVLVDHPARAVASMRPSAFTDGNAGIGPLYCYVMIELQ